jgi:hypothetical protein
MRSSPELDAARLPADANSGSAAARRRARLECFKTNLPKELGARKPRGQIKFYEKKVWTTNPAILSMKPKEAY